MQKMSEVVEEFVKYIGLHRFNPELIQFSDRATVGLKMFLELKGESLDDVRKMLEPVMMDLLSSDAMKTIIEPLQKENKELKEKVLEFHKYKVFYDMQYELNHGKQEPKEKS